MTLTADSTPVYSEYAGEPDFREILERFVGTMPLKARVFRDSLAAENWEAVRAAAHQLKGAAGGYGFSELSEYAFVVESAAKTADREALLPALAVMLAYMERVVADAP